MTSGSLLRTLMAASLGAGAWLAGLEAVALASLYGVAPLALVWLALATWALSSAALVAVSLLVRAACQVGAFAALSLRVASALSRRPFLRRTLVVAGLLGSLLCQLANVTLYVRLYFGIHVTLSVVTMLCAHAGMAALLLGRPERDPVTTPRARVLGLGLALLSLVAVASSIAQVTMDMALRSHALDQGTLLAHELVALDRVTGLLGATELEVSGTLDPALRAALVPEPMRSPSGLARGANVVMVTVDSLRADRWLAGGAPRPLMPALEALGAEGVRFSRAYAPSCWTLHSMSSVLYGKLPSQLHFTPVGVSADYRFLPFDEAAAKNPLNFKKSTPVPLGEQGPGLVAMLRAAGYQTATVASYIFYFRDGGLTSEFEIVDEQGYRALGFGASGIAPVPMVERAEAFLDTRDPARPFFLWLHLMDPHAPYEARDEAAKQGGAEARYDSELRQVDVQLAALSAALTSRGLDERTLWIVHGDHGEEFGEHGGSFHASTLYEETVHVPFLLRLPRASAVTPHVVTAPIGLLDLGPTLLDVLGIAHEAPMMGRSLGPALTGKDAVARPILMECERFQAKKRAYLRWPFKLIADRATGTLQLFALSVDPGERNNLSQREPAILQLMANELAQLEQLLAAPRP